jgi:hypothetical protein
MCWCQTRYTSQRTSIIGDTVDQSNMTRANPDLLDLILGLMLLLFRQGICQETSQPYKSTNSFALAGQLFSKSLDDTVTVLSMMPNSPPAVTSKNIHHEF